MSGERPAFERAFRAHYAAVYRYVLRRVERRAVEDVVGETFLIAWRRYNEVAGDPLPWLLGIARRTCANHLRGRARRAELEARLAAEPARATITDTAVEEGTVVFSALASLRESDREAILLVAWDGLTNHQAAKVLNCGVGAFAVRLHRARRRLVRGRPLMCTVLADAAAAHSLLAGCDSVEDRMAHGVGIECAQAIPSLLELGDLDDIAGLVAPRPLLLCSAEDDEYSRDAPSIAQAAAALTGTREHHKPWRITARTAGAPSPRSVSTSSSNGSVLN